MRAKKSDPPDWKKVLGKVLNYAPYATPSGLVENAVNAVTSGSYGRSAIDDLRRDGVIPSNANAFIKFAMGDTEGLTEKDFSTKDLDMIRNLISEAEKQGRSSVQYHDYPSGKFPEDVDKMSTEGKVMTTLGRFAFTKDDEGNYTVSDQYDFNDSKKNIDYYSKVLGLTPEEYVSKYKSDPVGLNFDLKRKGVSSSESAYRILRGAYAPIISESREPMPVKVTLPARYLKTKAVKKDS